MNCTSPESKPDWKGYALKELDPDAARTAEAHLASCPVCREELATVRLTLDTLGALRPGQAQVDAAVAKAVAQTEARHMQEIQVLSDLIEQRDKQVNNMVLTSAALIR